MPLIVNLPHIGLIEVAGKDAKTFLQGQLTCDLNTIAPEKSQLGAHCNLKGRVQSLFRVMQWGPEVYMLSLPLRMVESAVADLKKYALFSQVVIQDRSDSFFKAGVCGATAAEFISTLSCLVYATKVPSPDDTARYEIYTTEPLAPTGEAEAWEHADILAGLPAIYPETRGLFHPHHLGLFELGAIGLEKGCYLGQEIIARMHYKGKIKKTLMFRFAKARLDPGHIVESTENAIECGTIVRIAEVGGKYPCLMVVENAY